MSSTSGTNYSSAQRTREKRQTGRLFSAAALCLLLSAGCSRKSEVDAIVVVKGTVEQTVTSVTSGTVNAEKEVQLAFGAVGRVSHLGVHAGSVVKQGAVLAEIENGDLRSALSQADRELKRAQTLNRTSATTDQELERAHEQREIAYGAFEKSLIRAPFDGMITEVNLEVGQLSQITAINPKALLRMVDMAPRYVSTDIDEVDLPRIRRDLPARIKILAVRREPFAAKVRLVIPFVSAAREQDRTARVELSILEQELHLPAGASADVEIVAAERQDVVITPTRAILGRGEHRFVYRLSGSTIQRAPVTTGIGNYDRTEITAGLATGDIVLLPSDKVTLAEGLDVKTRTVAWP